MIEYAKIHFISYGNQTSVCACATATIRATVFNFLFLCVPPFVQLTAQSCKLTSLFSLRLNQLYI